MIRGDRSEAGRARVLSLPAAHFTFAADHVGARITPFFEPIGVNQVRQVIVRMFPNGLEESSFLIHYWFPSLVWMRKIRRCLHWTGWEKFLSLSAIQHNGFFGFYLLLSFSRVFRG